MPENKASVKDDKSPVLLYLIGSIGNVNRDLEFCPYATTLTAFSEVLGCEILSQIKCKRWGCRHCGPRKVTSLAIRVKEAKPVKLITLTVDPKCYENPREAFDKTRRMVTQLAGKIRKKYGHFEYMRILETTKAGWPHFHLLASCKYIPQRWLSNTWCELTGATIVDVRKVKKGDDIYFYVLKYLSKQKYIPWTNRRISWSKHFFPESSKPKGQNLQLRDKMYYDSHPSEVMSRIWKGRLVAAFNKDVYYENRNIARSRMLREQYSVKQ